MNRHTDVVSQPRHVKLPPLPPIDWKTLSKYKPKEIKIDYKGIDASLPKVDIVIITWTQAEWSALDHVFLTSTEERSHSSLEFEKNWYKWKSFGYYQLVEIATESKKNYKVLLFKSSAHLAHPNWIQGLSEMVEELIKESHAKKIYSIGTAGAASVKENLGDTAITNAGHIELQKPENIKTDYNNTTITGKWFPNLKLVPYVEKNLLFPLSKVVTDAQLESLIDELHSKDTDSVSYKFKDLVNAPLMPKNLHHPKGLDYKGMPLLTTDFYYIEESGDSKRYCALEMDDTVVGHIAQTKDIDFVFFRNISDTVVPDKDHNGKDIPKKVRDDWSGLIYENFGLYTSMNGALLTWATIAGD